VALLLRPALIAVLLGAASCAAAQEAGGFYGLLRSRDLSPFGFLRLDMRPAHAVTIERGTWAVETVLDYQNTWALSKGVESYLVGLESRGRRTLGATEVQAIRDLDGENYLLDFEAAMLSVTGHYKLSERWSLYGVLSAVRYDVGWLDGTIENFHDALGFSSFGRPAVVRDRAALIYDLKGAQVTLLDRPTSGGWLDPVIGARYGDIQLPRNWKLTAEVALKLPLRGEQSLISTGRTDYGAQLALRRTGLRHAVYLNTAIVRYAGVREPVPQEEQLVPTLILGYEYRWTQRTNINIQVYASKSVYSSKQTDLSELTGDKYQYSVGLRHRRGKWLWTFGFEENFQNVNNTPDVGLQFGAAWIPHSAR